MAYVKVQRDIGGRTLTLETGKVAKLCSAAVIATYGGTTVLATVVRAAPREGLDFFPLTIDYREKTSAAGKFPGGFKKREGPPSEKEILTMRMIDRPIVSVHGSGHVAVVSRRKNGYFLTHLEGLAFPLVNGESIGLTSRLLGDGDLIELSGTMIRFRVQQA